MIPKENNKYQKRYNHHEEILKNHNIPTTTKQTERVMKKTKTKTKLLTKKHRVPDQFTGEFRHFMRMGFKSPQTFPRREDKRNQQNTLSGVPALPGYPGQGKTTASQEGYKPLPVRNIHTRSTIKLSTESKAHFTLLQHM